MKKRYMSLEKLILELIKNPQEKVLVEIGSHDDGLTLELAESFKKVFSYYEYLKIPERIEGNIEIKKLPYFKVLEQLDKFDVILLKNEFHHFPDIWQMWTYDKLRKGQELLLMEWDFTGNFEDFYIFFQNCRPLCELTQEILSKFVKKKVVRITKKVNSKWELNFSSKKEMIDYFKFQSPDHYKFGEKDFLNKINNLIYPFTLWEGFNLFKIEKI